MITQEQDKMIQSIIDEVYNNNMNPEQARALQKSKNDALIAAVEEIEGKVMSGVELSHYGERRAREGRPNEEFVLWRNKPILHLKWSLKTGELKVLKLYKDIDHE